MKWSEYMRKYSLLLIQTMMSSLHNLKLCNGKISCFMDQFPFRAHFIEVTKVRLRDPISLIETTKAVNLSPMNGPRRLKNFIMVGLRPRDMPFPTFLAGGPFVSFVSSWSGIGPYCSPIIIVI